MWQRKNEEDATLAYTASCQLVGTINNADEEKASFFFFYLNGIAVVIIYSFKFESLPSFMFLTVHWIFFLL